MEPAPLERVNGPERNLQSGRVEIVVVYNEPETLRRVFLESRGLETAKLILIDNRSPSRSLPKLFNHHKASSPAEWIVFCHQDFVVREEGWLDRIRRLSPDACYGPVGVDRRGRILGRITQTDGSPLGEPGDLQEVVALDEMCVVVPRRVFATLDFDEQFAFDFYVQDYCQATVLAGFQCRIIQLDCQHRSKSVGGNTQAPRYLEARAAFLAKHGHREPRGLFNVSRRYSDPLQFEPTFRAIVERIPSSSRILQIGVGSGMLTYGLRRKEAVIDAIEPDPVRISYAAPYGNKMQQGDPAKSASFASLASSYDMVVIEHLLERTANPALVIQNAARVLDPSGILLVVLRNCGHLTSLLERAQSGRRPAVRSGVAPPLEVETTIELLQRAGLALHEVVRITAPLLDEELIGDPVAIPLPVLWKASRQTEPSTYDFILIAGRDLPPSVAHSTGGTRHRRELAQQLDVMGWRALHAEPRPSRRIARALAFRSFWVSPSRRALAYWIMSWLPEPLLMTILSRRSR